MLPKVRIRACRYAACFDNRATSRRTKLQYTPLLRTSTCVGPSSQTRPACSTTIRSKLRKLDRRCAIAMTVRPPVKRTVCYAIHVRAVKKGYVLWNDGDGGPQALLGHPSNVSTSDQNAPALHIVETLQQHEEGRFATA